jgi:hypothetical protein
MLLRETQRNRAARAVEGLVTQYVFAVQKRVGLLPFAFPGESIKPMRYKEDLSL